MYSAYRYMFSLKYIYRITKNSRVSPQMNKHDSAENKGCWRYELGNEHIVYASHIYRIQQQPKTTESTIVYMINIRRDIRSEYCWAFDLLSYSLRCVASWDWNTTKHLARFKLGPGAQSA